MASSDDMLKSGWEGAGGEKVTPYEDGKGFSDQIENGKKPDTKISPWDDSKPDF